MNYFSGGTSHFLLAVSKESWDNRFSYSVDVEPVL